MNGKNENGRSSATAKDLLSKLQKTKQDNEKPARKTTTYKDYIAQREKNKPEEDFDSVSINETPDGLDFAAVFDEVYAETVVGAQPVAEAEVEAEVEVEVELQELSEELVADSAADNEYDEYFADIEAALAEDDFSGLVNDDLADLEGFAPEAVEDNTYTEDTVVPEEGMYYEDVLPEDDFFDNDPIEEYEEDGFYEEAPEIQEEYDETRDFEHLVEEVMGSNSSDELDETDISLMVALGMEDELAKTVGEETATQMTDDYVADQEEWVDRTNRFDADEYTDASQNNEIADKYRKRHTISFWKMIAAFLLTAGIMFFENLPVIGYQFEGAFDPAVYPVVYIMADLQILLLVAALVAGRLFKGLGEAFRFRHSVDCLPAVLTLFAIVNSVVMAITTTPGVEPVMFNFATALCLFFTALNEYMTVRREIFSFNIISSKRPKFVMRRLSQRDSVLESEAVADMDAQVADDGDIIKIQKTDFVDGYFWRTRAKGTVSRSVVGLACVISVSLAIVVAIYAFVAKIHNPVNIGFAVLSAAVPASMVVVGFYPFYRANRKAYDSDSTIIGEASVEEYSGVGVISFDDVNVFPSYSVKVRNVRLFNNSRIDKVLYYAASVFSATGGPLADVFEVATMETGHAENVRILETGTGYIEAEVNGKSIMFGRAQALAKHGILIPDDIICENQDLPVDCSVMYMIYQRKLVAKMIVNYVLDSDFEYVLKQLTGSGMCVCVKTFDPNIDEDMILRQLPHNKYSMRVIKYKNTEEITKYSQRAEGGIVSRDNTKALLHTVSSCDKVISAQKAGNAIGIVSAILNVIIMAVVLMAGSFNSMYSLYIVLCQLFWLIPVVITTKIIVR